MESTFMPSAPAPGPCSDAPESGRIWTYTVLALGLSGLASGSQAATPSFSNQTAAAGVTFTHGMAPDTPGDRMHSGGSAGDFNNDGWPDLYVVGGGLEPDRLFINNGDGTFTDQAAAWGLTVLHRGGGSAVGDFNNDGWLDLFVATKGDMGTAPANGKHKLYRNNGDGTFTNIGVAAGVASSGALADGYGTTWGDYDLDGDLDLWIGGWHHFDAQNANRLFRNNGDETFTDVTVAAGVFDPLVQGFGAIFADMNADRYPELLIAGDFGSSDYFANNRDGTFTKIDIFGPYKVYNGMGTTIGDVNRDGLPDWFITAIWPAYLGAGAPGNRLYINNGNHNYTGLPELAGVNDGGWGWGTNAADFDHDGWVDIMMNNGWTVPNQPGGGDPVTGEIFWNEQVYLFRNKGNLAFESVGQLWGLDYSLQGRGLVQFDYDRDGDIDVVLFSNPIEFAGSPVLAQAGEMHLFRNDLIDGGPTPADAAWLKVKLDTSAFPHLAPNGRGSIVRARVGDENGKVRHVTVNGGSNYLGQGEMMAHFGLGAAESLQQVFVEWPDGFKKVVSSPAINQELTIAPEIPYSHPSPLVRGRDVELTIVGLRPNEQAYFLASRAGQGQGPCYPVMGGLCTDLLNPRLMGIGQADASGTVKLTVTIPALPNPQVGAAPDHIPTPNGAEFDGFLHSQALTRRGANGVASLKTNVVTAPIFKIVP